MAKKDKKLLALAAVGVAALAGVLVFQLRGKGTPATAQAHETPESLSLRPKWDVVGRALRTAETVSAVDPVSNVELPRCDPFEVSELLQRQFGGKRPDPRTAASRPADTQGFDEQKWLEEETARIDARRSHFLRTYTVKIIMATPDGHEATVFDGEQHLALKKGDRVEDCVVSEVTVDSVHLKSVPKPAAAASRKVACKTYDLGAERAAMVEGKAVRLGQIVRGWVVKEIGDDWVLLELPKDSRLRRLKPLPYAVRLTMRTD